MFLSISKRWCRPFRHEIWQRRGPPVDCTTGRSWRRHCSCPAGAVQGYDAVSIMHGGAPVNIRHNVGSWLVSWGAPPNNSWILFNLDFFKCQGLLINWFWFRFQFTFNWFQLILNWFQLISIYFQFTFNWFQFTFNWCQFTFNLCSIDFNLVWIYFQLISTYFQVTSHSNPIDI
jgi:hypothetical protein